MAKLLNFIAMDQFPNRINELRRAAGLSQEALGELLSTSKQQVGRYENGKQELTLEWMRRFASALGCSPADILSDADNPGRLPVGAERLVNRYLAASPERQEDLERVAETLIPYRHQPRTAA